MELHVCDILKSQLQRSAMVDYVFTAQNLNYFILVLTIPAVEIVHKWSFSTPNIGVEFLFEIFRPQKFDPSKPEIGVEKTGFSFYVLVLRVVTD